MRNADLPAMPQSATSEGHSCNYYDYGGPGIPTGLTKREMMAMHVMASIATTVGYQNYDQMAQDAISATDALLAELEKSQ